MGGLTRNLLGEEVWTLKAMGVVVESDLRRTLARHLQLSANSMRTSWSDTSTSLSIATQRKRERDGGAESLSETIFVCFCLLLRKARDSVGSLRLITVVPLDRRVSF